MSARVRHCMLVPAALAASALLLGACSSSGGGPQSLPTAVPTLPSRLPKTGADLATLMRHGLTTTASARIGVTASVAGAKITGTGHETVVNGALTGLDITLGAPGLHAVHVLLVNSVTYADLGARSGRHAKHAGGKKGSAKPWTAVPATVRHAGAHNPVAAVRRALDDIEPLGAPADVLALVGAGKVHLQGTGVLAGVPIARYTVTTAVRRLPAATPVRTVLLAQHVATIKLDLRVDGSGRPVAVQWAATGSHHGHSGAFRATANLRDYNRPVHLSAPKSGQVTTSG